MTRLSLRSKLLLLVVAGLSSIGINMGGKAAQAASCSYCVSIYSGDRLVGYGCVSGGRQGVCTAGGNYCSINYQQQCS